jgi:exodeoxyribonuclease VII large subunit
MRVLARETCLEREIYTVSRLNREVKWLLTDSFPKLWVEGEIADLRRPSSGHWYFTLKDERAQVRCAMFRQHNRTLGFTLSEGAKVLALAQVSLYEARGEYQLIVETLEEAGDGALRRAFEALKQRLAAEGLFERKRPLPKWPKRVGVITSPTGAAIRDVLTVLRRRFPGLEVILYPCQVQGETAKHEIVRALKIANQRAECDVLLLVRGGGSLEDLWAFNEESVARAIYASRIPVVTGIGHEIDFTIADFVADHRAPTPSAAALAVSPDGEEVHRHLKGLTRRIQLAVTRCFLQRRQELRWLSGRLHQAHPSRRLADLMQRLDELTLRSQRALGIKLTACRHRLETHLARLARHHPKTHLGQLGLHLAQLDRRLREMQKMRLKSLGLRLTELSRALDAVSPLATLARGYAIVTDLKTGKILTSARATSPGSRLQVRLAEGRLICEVKTLED